MQLVDNFWRVICGAAFAVGGRCIDEDCWVSTSAQGGRRATFLFSGQVAFHLGEDEHPKRQHDNQRILVGIQIVVLDPEQ